MAYICFVGISLISLMSVDSQEKVNCVKRKSFAFSVEGSRTIFLFSKFIVISMLTK